MTAVAFIHGHAHTPEVWRPVADHLPPAWAVVAPDLFAAARVGSDADAHRHDMAAHINRDLAMMGLEEPVIVVAEGLGAIPAIHYAVEHPGRVAGVFVSGPRLALRRGESMRLQVGAVMRRKGPTAVTSEQMGTYLAGLVGLDEREAAAQVRVPRVAIAGEKDSVGTRGATELQGAGWERDVAREASEDWYSYAPAAFAARVAEFAAVHGL
ncbi:hypothetical protein QP858_09065 [Trueperella bernardiae]|uniref:AB hydrolase-1 domain-containing protein n=1 Tax=Trueperella bernardiae TaxID=59561 RepID=A0AAW6ZL67_9ACTO|nr:alpha/beta fold hydrolase [Trueperella bernardiae]MDK8602606.1 hypothetical protein [Trueperella bernardiae]